MTTHQTLATTSFLLTSPLRRLAAAACLGAATLAPACGAFGDAGFSSSDDGTQSRIRPSQRAERSAVLNRLGQLDAASTGRWRMTLDDKTGLPRALRGGPSRPYPGSSRDAATAFLAEHASLLGIDAPLASIRATGARGTHLGMRETFVQKHGGLDVVDGGIAVHIDSEGRVLAVVSSAWPIGEINLQPTLDAASARRLLVVEARSDRLWATPELVIVREGDGRLGYRIGSTLGDEALPWEWIIDAHTGELIMHRPIVLECCSGHAHVHDAACERHQRGKDALEFDPPVEAAVDFNLDACDRDWGVTATPAVVAIEPLGDPSDPYEMTVTLGTPSEETASQAETIHAAGITLLPCIEYTVTFTWDLHTWDSYSGGEGFWDVFFVLASSEGFYWDLVDGTPVADLACSTSFDTSNDFLPGALWTFGGLSFLDSALCSSAGEFSFTYHEPDHEKKVFLSVGLDTGLSGAVDGEMPSWGTFAVKIAGSSKIFNPTPIAVTGMPLVDMDDSNEAVPCPAYESVELDLHTPAEGEPWTVEGDWAAIRDLDLPLLPWATEIAFTPPTSHGPFFPYLRDCDGFEAVNCYHHIDASQTWIKFLGFTGISGINERQILVDPHAFKERNAFYMPDGSGTGVLYFGDGFWTDPDTGISHEDVDAGEDGDVIQHEYGHAIQDNQVPGGFLTAIDNNGFGNETRAIGEGFGDYWAASMNYDSSVDHGFNPAIMGEWMFGPEGLRRLDNTKTFPDSMIRNFHLDGEIWAGALFDVFMHLGRATTDTLVLESHFLLAPGGADFGENAEMIIFDDALTNGGANEGVLAGIFHARGILRMLEVSAEGLPVPIDVDVVDVFGEDDGTADFSRLFQWGELVTLTAPPEFEDQPFSRWKVGDTFQPIGALSVDVAVKKDLEAEAIYSGEALSCGSLTLAQHTSDDIEVGVGVACVEEGISQENGFARSFDLSSIEDTAGRELTVRCVDIAIDANSGSALSGTVNIYRDTDGGAPEAPGTDLELLGSTGIYVNAGATASILTTTFDEPVIVPANTTMVVEVLMPRHNDGAVWPGSNEAPQTGATYIRAADCGAPTYVSMDDLGFPAVSFVLNVHGDVSCAADFDGSGSVDGSDLGVLLANWGTAGPGDLDGSGIVDGGDMGLLLGAWGDCSE